MKSIFPHKNLKPNEETIQDALENTFPIWKQIENFTISNYNGISEWHFSGEKYGWSLRINDKKRVVVYLLPREKYFKIALVFGQKALDRIFESDIAETIISELRNSKRFAEGTGIRIAVKDPSCIDC